MNLKVASLTALVAAAFAAPALAHHSFAMFDADKTMTLSGTVKEFEWAQPAFLAPRHGQEVSGKPALWAQLSSPSRLITMGMHANSVKPGDVVTVTFHPMEEQVRAAANHIQAKLPDGKEIIRANGPQRGAVSPGLRAATPRPVSLVERDGRAHGASGHHFLCVGPGGQGFAVTLR